MSRALRLLSACRSASFVAEHVNQMSLDSGKARAAKRMVRRMYEDRIRRGRYARRKYNKARR